MRNDDIPIMLTGFGLTEEEASTYYLLVKNGPTTATDTAKHLGTNRMRAYRALDSLVEKQFAKNTLERPKRYIAADIDEALSQYLDNYHQTMSQLKEKEREIIEKFKKIVKAPIEVEENAFRIIQGRRQVYRQIAAVLDRAVEEVFFYIPNNDLYRFEFADIDDKLWEASQRGVRINILTHIDENVLEKAEEYATKYNVRHIPSFTKLRFILQDYGEIFFSFPKDDTMSMTTRDDTGLWTNTQDFVIAMRSFFEENWAISQESEPVIDALRRGKPLQFIGLISDREEHSRIYGKMIEEALESIDIMTKNTALTLSNSKAIREAHDRGVKIRFLAVLSYESLESLLQIFSLDQIKGAESSRFDILLVDRKRVIMFIPTYEELGNSITSNNEIYVETISEVFEDYWIRGVDVKELGQRLITESRFNEVISLLSESLGAGYLVERNKQIISRSGSIEINLYIMDQEKEKATIIEFALSGEGSGKIAELYAKASELDTKAFLVSFDEFTPSAKSLADLFNIKLINSKKIESLSQQITKELQVS